MKQDKAVQRVVEFLSSQPNKEAMKSVIYGRCFKCGVRKEEIEELQTLLCVTGQIEVILRQAKNRKTATRTAVVWRLK